MIKSRARKQADIAPMAHQQVSIDHGRKQPEVYDASDTGTGKTPVRIWLFAERRRKKGGCALVLAPRSLLTSAWANDFRRFAPDMKVSVARANNREDAFAADADVYITNHDGVKWLALQKKPFFEKFSELIIDEITAFKHHTSQRSRAAAKISKHFKYRSGLSATPNGVSITDLWHQVYLLDNGKRLGSSFYGFRGSVCQPTQVGRNVNAVQWADKEGAEEAVYGLLDGMVIRHRRDDCLDLPANHLYTVPYTMSPRARKAYNAMYQDHVLPLLGDSAAQMRARLKRIPTEMTGVNAAAVTGKLLQIASGAVYDNDSNVQAICDERYELILDLVEARKHSLVFFFWRHQADALALRAEKRGMTFCVYDTELSDKERDGMVAAYQAGKYQVMFAHPQNAAHGLTLTRGTATIWPGPTYDLERFRQGNGRQQRIGQTEKTETIVVLAEDSIEERIYHEILMNKNERMVTLLDLFSSLTSNLDLAA